MPIGNKRIEDVAPCPGCGKLRVMTKSQGRTDDRGHPCDVAVYVCDTEGCKWYQEGQLIQTTPDGRVYERERRADGRIEKTFPDFTPDQLAYGRRQVEQVIEADTSVNNELPN